MAKELLIDGILPVDKPKDWTSHDVCAFMRKRFHIKKVGHAGTLDPMATGLLVLLLGKATKSSMMMSGSDKEYEGVMELGVETDSHDLTGEVIERKPWEGITLDRIREKAIAFTGEIIQIPPMVSALKYQGERLYKLARRGKVVPREGRPVTVHSFEISRIEDAQVYFTVRVSKGTYVRTLIHDLGHALGTCAALAGLRRTRSGGLSVDASLTIEKLKQLEPEKIRDHVFPVYALSSYAGSLRP